MQFSENDQAKPDLFSRLACSTLLSKILATLRLSGAVWIEAWLLRQVVLELVALAGFAVQLRLPAFLREPFKSI
jgi:hypothetical protein